MIDAKKLMEIADKYAFFIPGSVESEDARKELENAISGFESALLAKLAVMELPEPDNHSMYGYTKEHIRQAYAQGAASVLSAEPSNVFTKINGEWVSGKPGNKEPS